MLRRHIADLLLSSLREFPAVFLAGARQVGKSTLAQSLASGQWPAKYATLDDRIALDAALRDPDSFLAGLGSPLVLDEVQRAPDLMRALKLSIDRDRRPGRFLLTGSANILALPRVAETLAGRLAVHQLQPLSWTERYADPAPATLDALFEARSAPELLDRLGAARPAAREREEVQSLILRGGYPTPSLARSEQTRRTWFESYRQTYIERDLRDLADIVHLPDFSRLLGVIALRTGTMLNFSSLSRDIGLPLTTLRRYFGLLERTFQVRLLHPYVTRAAGRMVKTPKVYMGDTGLACHLGASDTWATLERQDRVGALIETWAVNEILKLLPLCRRTTSPWYWRTRGGSEVDLLLECGGEVVGIEVKWAAGTRGGRDLAGLAACRDFLRRRWRLGILLHMGADSVAIDDRTAAIPFGRFFGRGGVLPGSG